MSAEVRCLKKAEAYYLQGRKGVTCIKEVKHIDENITIVTIDVNNQIFQEDKIR
jgi:hypothetical protein